MKQAAVLLRPAIVRLFRQRLGTVKEITLVTVEDEAGVVNLIVHVDVWEMFQRVAGTSPAFIASGRFGHRQATETRCLQTIQ